MEVRLSAEKTTSAPIPVLCCCDPDNVLGFVPELPEERMRPYAEEDSEGNLIRYGYAYPSSILEDDPHVLEARKGRRKQGSKQRKKSSRRKSRKGAVKRNKRRWL